MELYLFFAGDMILVFLVSLAVNKQLRLPLWKIIVFTVAIVPIGVFCGKLMRLVEAGTMEGVSFYGAVLFAPAFMIAVGLLTRIKPYDMLDLCAPAGCIALIFMKIQCLITGCCYGRVISHAENGARIRFPSQIVEMADGIIILIVIMLMIKSGKQRGFIFAWFMLLYGVTRFFLNLLRETTPFVLGLSAGCLWSIIAGIIGGGALVIKWKKGIKVNA